MTIIAFLLAIVSAVLLFTIAPKQVTKADEEENEVLATYTFTLINNDTEYSVGCSNTSVCTKAEIPSEYNGLPVTSIGDYAFSNCSGLTSITIPDSVTNIGRYVFEGCSKLASVVIGESVTSINYAAFHRCSKLASVVIGESVTSIGDYAFKDCSSLASVVIPDSVTSIGFVAFKDCSKLASVVIGESVTSIGERAFEGCSSLMSVIIYASNPPVLNTNVFLENLTAIYVPAESIDSYIGADGWSNYETIIQPIPVQENNNETNTDEKKPFDFGEWLKNAGEDVSAWLGENVGIATTGSTVLIIGAVIIAVMLLKKRR